MATETIWDGGATTWDPDHAGPGTRTIWDALPEFVSDGAQLVSRKARTVMVSLAARVAMVTRWRR